MRPAGCRIHDVALPCERQRRQILVNTRMSMHISIFHFESPPAERRLSRLGFDFSLANGSSFNSALRTGARSGEGTGSEASSIRSSIRTSAVGGIGWSPLSPKPSLDAVRKTDQWVRPRHGGRNLPYTSVPAGSTEKAPRKAGAARTSMPALEVPAIANVADRSRPLPESKQSDSREVMHCVQSSDPYRVRDIARRCAAGFPHKTSKYK